MALQELLPAGVCDLRILATDIDTDVLDFARAGRYREDRFDGVGGIQRFFERNGAELQVRRALRERIEFARVNLTEPWDVAHRFDAVFCRNVIIYFDRPTQQALFARFGDQLAPGGHLFLGHSETMSGMDAVYEAVGQTVRP